MQPIAADDGSRIFSVKGRKRGPSPHKKSMDQTNEPVTPVTKPKVTFWAIWNMCFGFLGLQFGLGLQNANVSRIFQTLGAQASITSRHYGLPRR